MSESLWRTYQQWLAVAAVGLFFTNVVVFTFGQGLVAIPPRTAVLFLCVLSLPLLASPEVMGQVLRMPLVVWVLGYVALVSAGFFISRQDQVALDALRNAAAAALTLLAFVLILTGAPAQRTAQRAVLLVTVLSVCLNVYELLHPGVFGRLYGRSAGLYQNPNISGGAIVLGALLSYPVVRPVWRPYLFMFAGVGVLLTFSRGAMLAWLATIGMLLTMRAVVMSRRQLAILGFAIVTTFVIVPAADRAAVADAAVVLTSDQVGRLVGSSREGGNVSSAIRVKAARDAWELFAEAPVFGAGLGATRYWDDGVSTHNMYLLFLAESGAVGCLWYLLVVVAAMWPAPRTVRAQVLGVCAFWLLWGMVSHNMLEERPMLLGLAMIGCIVGEAHGKQRKAAAQRTPNGGS